MSDKITVTATPRDEESPLKVTADPFEPSERQLNLLGKLVKEIQAAGQEIEFDAPVCRCQAGHLADTLIAMKKALTKLNS